MRTTSMLGTAVLLSLVIGGGIEARRTQSTPSKASPAPAKTTGIVHIVAVVTDATVDARARHGVQRLEAALRAKGLTVNEDQKEIAAADTVIVVGLGAGSGAAARTLTALKAPVPAGLLGFRGLTCRRSEWRRILALR